jgi:hypothetical protein
MNYTVNGPFIILDGVNRGGPSYKLDANFDLDISWEKTSKRRLNTNRILPKSKRNHNIIQPWQSSYKRWNRNPHIIERLLVKKCAKEICDEIDKELMADLVKLFRGPLFNV